MEHKPYGEEEAAYCQKLHRLDHGLLRYLSVPVLAALAMSKQQRDFFACYFVKLFFVAIAVLDLALIDKYCSFLLFLFVDAGLLVSCCQIDMYVLTGMLTRRTEAKCECQPMQYLYEIIYIA